MRISTSKADVGYSPFACRWCALLDGLPLERCYMADEERGEAFVYVTNSEGHLVPIFDENSGEHILLTERLTGNVRLVLEPEQAGHG